MEKSDANLKFIRYIFLYTLYICVCVHVWMCIGMCVSWCGFVWKPIYAKKYFYCFCSVFYLCLDSPVLTFPTKSNHASNTEENHTYLLRIPFGSTRSASPHGTDTHEDTFPFIVILTCSNLVSPVVFHKNCHFL